MRCFGHRGAKGYALENTLASFQKALELGVSWIELDVQEVNGSLFVFHDIWLDRLFKKHVKLGDLTPQEIHALRLEDGQYIPSLSEVFDSFLGKLKINIELKGNTGAAPLAAMIEGKLSAGWKAEDIIVSSFNVRELYELHTRCPNIWIGLLYFGLPYEFKSDIAMCGARSIHISLDYASSEVIKEIQALGCKAFIYTVNHERDIAAMKQYGADGVFSDFPDRVLKISNQSKSSI